MTNKVKPFYIKITNSMTPQMVQDAFDKCVDAGANAFDGILGCDMKHNYDEVYEFHFVYFGVDFEHDTYLTDDQRNYGIGAQEITLDQLDEWLGLEVEQEWDGKGLPPAGTACEVMFTLDTTPRWYQCTISYSCQGVGVLDIEGEKCAFTTASSNGHSVKFRKPETPEQKAERERLEAAYDLYSEFNSSCGYKAQMGYDGFIDSDLSNNWLTIVEKTNYRKQ